MKMNHMSKRVRLTAIAIAIWTIIQTIFHASWVIPNYLWTVCKIKPTYYDVVFVYLTYFYRESCGPIEVTNEAYFLNNTTPGVDFIDPNHTVSETLYSFVKATLDRGHLPERSKAASRMDIYLYLFLYTDATWVVSSVFLFVGAFYEQKQKFMSILFYGPWMLVCFFVSFLDVVASVHFGLDIIYTHNYTTWLKFVGVSNYQDFESFNDYASSKFILSMPSTIIVCVLSRFFLIWLVNIICFFIILFMVIPDIFFKDIVKPTSKSKRTGGSKLQFDTGEELDLNSSEARIRNWQLFYGAIEANSTMASTSSSSSASSNSTDHNSNSRTNEDDTKINKRQFDVHYEKNLQMLEPSTISSGDSGFRRYSDVASGLPALPSVAATNVKIEVLRSQLPWSYMSPEGKLIKKNHTYVKDSTTQKTVAIRDIVTDSSRL